MYEYKKKQDIQRVNLFIVESFDTLNVYDG